MTRQIFLPELLNIHIKNYTLYPNGLDYSFNFVHGINLVLGGNGMGKTTFINIIKCAILGPYKKPFDYNRTYLNKAIEKRSLYPKDYFRNRMDESINIKDSPLVAIVMKFNNSTIKVTRDLNTLSLNSIILDGINIEGERIDAYKYDNITKEEQKNTLQYKYEQLVKEYTNLDFDDLIFFVNEILFFGEDHKTILWNDNESIPDVQNELFNKYFNEPELDKMRQEAQRKERYYDSLSRHRSEDMRAINKVLKTIQTENNNGEHNDFGMEIINLNNKLNKIEEKLLNIQKLRSNKNNKILLLQEEINKESIQASALDKELHSIENFVNKNRWCTLHPLYNTFIRNIIMNHVCPICMQSNDILPNTVEKNSNKCFVCGKEINKNEKSDDQKELEEISIKRNKIYQSIKTKKFYINELEKELESLDEEFSENKTQKRTLEKELRDIELKNELEDKNYSSQAIIDEIERLSKEKKYFMTERDKQKIIADNISMRIEEKIVENTIKFSNIFSSFAKKFLGVDCYLTYTLRDGYSCKRFYPVIDGKVRYSEDELSESQRFFIDHSFRMSILTFFYTKPSFYIVETPDSSLDLSYEKNAADVFINFLNRPYCIIITSNLNNSSFIEQLINNAGIDFSLVGLLDIAKHSIIQGSNQTLKLIYNKIKSRVHKNG